MKKRIATGIALLSAVGLGATMTPQTGVAAVTRPSTGGLPLGPAELREQRTTRSLGPGVTLTRIVRGDEDPSLAWTVEVAIPGGSTSPDPDAPATALKDRESAEELASELRADGFDARTEQVSTEPMADFEGGALGWRVRVGRYASQTAADVERSRLVAAGYSGATLYTGWDGEADEARGPWRVDVLRVDPDRFSGELDGSFGPDLETRERTSDLARAAGAVAAVNGGFFVFDPRAGAPGDPAGVGVYEGDLLSEPVGGRPALVLRPDARKTDVVRTRWAAAAVAESGDRLPLDGVNRVPGLIRNCGGTLDDTPTDRPWHDFTCTDDDELVAFSPAFGAITPQGEGVEVVLDRRDVVVDVRSPRGGPLPAGGSSVQATGDHTVWLRAHAEVGDELQVRTRLVGDAGKRLPLTPGTAVINGGPELVRDGEVHATPATDGMVHAGNPSFYYGWVHKRHPRTFAGVDGKGRLVLITVDGRSTSALGLSIAEAAEVAQALGLRQAVNLDGGGSTTMVVDGQVINQPSDTQGERPVGDAVLVSPTR